MADEAKAKRLIFPIVPRLGERPWGHTVVVYQTHDRVENGIQTPGITREMTPRIIEGGLNAYVIEPIDDVREHRIEAMKRKMQKENRDGQPKRILGPFESAAEAAKAMHTERPKTPEEVIPALSDENSALKKRIAELEASINKKEVK